MSHHKLKKEDIEKRLNKMIGQMNGIKKMINEDRDCPDILLQIASVRSALGNLGLMITEDHMEHCIPCFKSHQVDMAIKELLQSKCCGGNAPSDLVQQIKFQIGRNSA